MCEINDVKSVWRSDNEANGKFYNSKVDSVGRDVENTLVSLLLLM